MLDSENFPFEESDRETSTSPGSSFSASSPLAGGILGEEELRTIPSYRIRRRRPNCVKITKIEVISKLIFYKIHCKFCNNFFPTFFPDYGTDHVMFPTRPVLVPGRHFHRRRLLLLTFRKYNRPSSPQDGSPRQEQQ